MQAAAYVRVSSRSQSEAMQVDAIGRAARARGDELLHLFAEKQSARKMDRPVLAKLRDAVRRGELRTLYVFRIDRLTRSGIRDTLTLLEEFKRNGCRVVSIADGFDLDGPVSDVVIAVMAWAAQMERLAIEERIAAARARKEAKGEPWGRPPRLNPNDVEAIRARRELGQTVRQISVALKITKSVVGRALSQKRTQIGRDTGSHFRGSGGLEPPASP